MKIWKHNNGAIEHNGIRIHFDEIHKTHIIYTIMYKGEIVATLDTSLNIIRKDKDMMPQINHPICKCNLCKGDDV